MIDQRAGKLLKMEAQGLAHRMAIFEAAFPGKPVDLIALSAGTGVAIWAVEQLPDGQGADDVVLLGSSLSSTYNLGPALRKIRGKVYVFYSDQDAVIADAVSVAGTVDGKWNVPCIGGVGAQPPADADQQTQDLYAAKVVNIAWRPAFADYGYTGSHTSATSKAFVQNVIAPLLMGQQPAVGGW